MAPNGTSRKTPTPATHGKPASNSLISKSLLNEIFADTDKKPTKINENATKKIQKVTKPGAWDSEVAGKDASMSLVVNRVSSDMARGFSTGRPLADKPRVVRCTHCKRAVLEHRAKGHVEECIAKKQEKQRKKKEAKDARDAAARREREGSESAGEGDEIVLTGSKTARKTDGPDEEGASKSKKRRAEDADNGPSKKKKKKDEPKAKAPRPKAPVDVEKQCGVDLPQGGQCARSLTCKSHSMGSKRGVAGRSAPYDKLLAEYQRKNQAKLQKAALESQPLLPEDELAPTGPIDSDEEKDLVLAAIARSRPQPLYQARVVPLRKRYQFVRLKEMLGNALGGRGGSGLFGLAPAQAA